jgi:hypothetical protein
MIKAGLGSLAFPLECKPDQAAVPDQADLDTHARADGMDTDLEVITLRESAQTALEVRLRLIRLPFWHCPAPEAPARHACMHACARSAS